MDTKVRRQIGGEVAKMQMVVAGTTKWKTGECFCKIT